MVGHSGSFGLDGQPVNAAAHQHQVAGRLGIPAVRLIDQSHRWRGLGPPPPNRTLVAVRAISSRTR